MNFVLLYEGFISTGLSESRFSTSGKWNIEGNVHLVDTSKTQLAGKNVDKRISALNYTSDTPTTLFLDGKTYDLKVPCVTTDMGRISPPGRMCILRDEGDPTQATRTLALRGEKDLETISHFAEMNVLWPITMPTVIAFREWRDGRWGGIHKTPCNMTMANVSSK